MRKPPPTLQPPKRLAVRVSGVVQGVGFRPFVHGVATRLRCAGFVRNAGTDVDIEVEGDGPRLDRFLAELTRSRPPQARIAHMRSRPVATRGETAFGILPSIGDGPGGPGGIAPDAATCDECVSELLDPGSRRYRHAFISCSGCGPRFTIALATPFDRERTTMARFAPCVACAREYADPADRRFHAQTIACPACGPRLALLGEGGGAIASADAVADAAAALRGGAIVAVKGIGGYHLACRADDAASVARLRAGKRREAKPFAVLVADLAAARELGRIGEAEAERLASPQRPVVLVPRRPGIALAAGVGAGSPLIGLMLPYTPVHHLLARDVAAPLVMTSGNRSGEPITADDAAAVARLGGIADLLLVHDRAIAVACDDGVERVAGGRPIVVRRARGRTPEPVALPLPSPVPLLALGGHLKSAFALADGRHACVSQHIGDLDSAGARRAYRDAVAAAERLAGIVPRLIVHDAHPDYATTRYARERASAEGIPTLAIQHHHAHLASCLADNGETGPAIGVVFDGAGLGADGAIWGGELLVGDLAASTRAGHLRYAPQPGGERAAREPWRMAVAHAREAGVDDLARLLPAIGEAAIAAVRSLCAGRACAPPTSSVGRLFDAVAALVGLRTHADHEGQAALELEIAAAEGAEAGAYPLGVERAADGLEMDPRPLIRALVADRAAGTPVAVMARRFHAGLAEAVAASCRAIAATTGVGKVALSGGVFQNALLTDECERRLGEAGLAVLRHRSVPPNDGGLCLGQAAAAAALRARDG